MEYVHLACAHLPLLTETLGSIDQIVATTTATAWPRSQSHAPSPYGCDSPFITLSHTAKTKGQASKKKKKKKVKAERHGLLYPRSSSSYFFKTPNKSQCNIDVFQNEFPDEMRLTDHSSCLKLPGCLLPTACPLSDLATQRWWLRSVTSHSSIEAQAQPWFVHIGR